MTVEQEKQFNKELELVEFYTLAQKYGFCTPYCECGNCEAPEQINWPIVCFTSRSHVGSSPTSGIMNKETEQAIEEARNSELVGFDDVDSLFRDLNDEEFREFLDLI